MTIPADILRVLRLVDWRKAYIEWGDDSGHWVASASVQSVAVRSAFRALSGASRGVRERAMLDECRTPLDRLVREYMLWRAYGVQP